MANVSGEGLIAVAKMVEGACVQPVCLPFPFLFLHPIFHCWEIKVYPLRNFSTGRYQKWPYLKLELHHPFLSSHDLGCFSSRYLRWERRGACQFRPCDPNLSLPWGKPSSNSETSSTRRGYGGKGRRRAGTRFQLKPLTARSHMVWLMERNLLPVKFVNLSPLVFHLFFEF